MSFDATGPLAAAALPMLDGGVRTAGERTIISTARPSETLRALLTWAQALAVDEIPGLTVTRPTLEDIYIAMLATEAAAGGAP